MLGDGQDPIHSCTPELLKGVNAGSRSTRSLLDTGVFLARFRGVGDSSGAARFLTYIPDGFA